MPWRCQIQRSNFVLRPIELLCKFLFFCPFHSMTQKTDLGNLIWTLLVWRHHAFTFKKMHIHIMSVRFFNVVELFFSFSAYICQHLRVWVDTIGWNHFWRWIQIHIYNGTTGFGVTELDRCLLKRHFTNSCKLYGF